MRLRNEPSWRRFNFIHQDHEGVAWNNLPAKTRFIAAEETEKAERGKSRAKQPTRALRGGFDHQHARKQRPARDVMHAPEFIGAHILRANALTQIVTRPNDAIALSHWPGLRQKRIERQPIADRCREINGCDVDKKRTGQRISERITPRLLQQPRYRAARAPCREFAAQCP